VGFGMGLERVLLALADEKIPPPEEEPLMCFVVAVGSEAEARASDVASGLRNAGLSTARSFEERPLKAQLRMADRAGARFAVITGSKEAEAGTITVRRLEDGHQVEFGLEEAIAWILREGSDTGGTS
jgi:histidyl-tRNA synthetase